MQHGQADLALISRNDDQRIEQTVDGVWRGSKEVVRSRRPSADVDFRSRAFARTADDLALAYGMLHSRTPRNEGNTRVVYVNVQAIYGTV